MKWISFGVGVAAVLFGISTVLMERTPLFAEVPYNSPWATLTVVVIGAVGCLLMLTGWRRAPWFLLAAAVLGAVPNFIMWEGAGTFFLASALLGFTWNQRRTA